ncbi:alpha/beta hydrolase [Nocardia sp. NPDC004860]|uniref:alpha/beta hydrolase n=1 Tax=Nocardia sp. NPDC004860 TaxID=3154557 RepID=UPI0033AAF397
MPQQPERVDVPSAGGVTIAAYRWDPQGPPGAIAQIVHGVGEHALRYAPLAERLAGRGLVVYAHDHRGHGATLLAGQEPGAIGADGWAELVADVGRVGRAARTAHPSLKLVLIAHSLGSYAAQQFLLEHSDAVDAVAMTGTAAVDLLPLDLDAPVDLAAFNAPFQPARTDFDWLSRDEAQVDAYVADPLCGFGLDIPGMKAMFAGTRKLADKSLVSAMRPDLPIYLAVGEQDPVNGQLALIHPLVDRYANGGLTDITLKVWEDARHEIFNETNRDEVCADLFTWIDRKLG